MNVDDVVRALKACGEGKAACAKCPWEKLHGEECHFAKSQAAAELIESLQAQLDSERKSANKWILAANDYRKENERLAEINKALESDVYNANMNFEHLAEQLTASQRRERAAVEDFTSAAHNGNILCEFCGADCIDAGNDTGGDTFQCGCFEWRGPQDEEGGRP